MNSSTTRPVILYAEDDFDDFDSVREALDQLAVDYEMHHAKNGVEAIELLQEHPDRVPNLIVLDLNMPIMNGKEVLQWLKENEPFKKIPVMVFTTSSREDDVKLCQRHDCTFFRKPTLYRDLLHIGQVMLQMAGKDLAAGVRH